MCALVHSGGMVCHHRASGGVIPTPFTSSIFIIGGNKMVGLSEDEVIVDEKLRNSCRWHSSFHHHPPSMNDEQSAPAAFALDLTFNDEEVNAFKPGYVLISLLITAVGCNSVQ